MLRVWESCRTHRARAWAEYRLSRRTRVEIEIENDRSFGVLFRTIMRRDPELEERRCVLVRGLIDCLARTQLIIARFSGAVQLSFIAGNKIRSFIDDEGQLVVGVPKRKGRISQRMSKKLMTRVVADAIIGWSELPLKRYARSRKRVWAAHREHSGPHTILILRGNTRDELRQIVTAVIVGRINLNELIRVLDATREAHVLGIFASLFLEPRKPNSRLVA